MNAARLARDDESYLSTLAERHLDEVMVEEVDGRTMLDRKLLAALPDPLAHRVVLSILSSHIGGRRLSSRHVLAVLDLARAIGAGTRVDLPGGLSAVRWHGRLVIGPAGAAPTRTGSR